MEEFYFTVREIPVMTAFIAGIVKQGLTYKVTKDGSPVVGWTVTLTGGF